MSNFLLKGFLSLIALVLLYFYAQSIYSLVSKTYFIDESKLYKLDTFHLYNRAYITSDGAAGRHSRSEFRRQLQFQSTNGYSFAIRGNTFESISKMERLKNVLLYDDNSFIANTTLNHDVAFIPYTSKEVFEEYKSTAYPIHIEVSQLQIGNTKYIDINQLNNLSRSRLKTAIIKPAFIAGVIILIVTIKPFRRRFSKIFNKDTA